jgi:hypothetical protein
VSKQRPHSLLGAQARQPKTNSVRSLRYSLHPLTFTHLYPLDVATSGRGNSLFPALFGLITLVTSLAPFISPIVPGWAVQHGTIHSSAALALVLSI